MNVKEKIQFIREQFSPYKVEFTTSYIFYRNEDLENRYNIEIIFNENLIITEDSFLNDIIPKIDLIKKEFEMLDLNNYINICNEFEQGFKFNRKSVKNFINMHLAINNFNIEKYKNYKLNNNLMYEAALKFSELNFYINHDFEKKKVRITNKYHADNRESIIFTLNNEGGMIFHNQNILEKVKLLTYYSELFNFKNNLLDSFEKFMLFGEDE